MYSHCIRSLRALVIAGSASIVCAAAAHAQGSALNDRTTDSTRQVRDDAARDRAESIRFENEGRDRLDVYLVGERRSWRIGRLAPGESRWLRMPKDITSDEMLRVQLVVLANAAITLAPISEARAVTTIRQPFFALAGQRWSFTEGQLSAIRAR